MQTKSEILLNNIQNLIVPNGELRYKSIVFNRETNYLVINIITNTQISSQDKEYIVTLFKKEIDGVNIEVNIEKSIADGEIAKSAIFKYIIDNFCMISHSFTDKDISIITNGKNIKYTINVSEEIYDYCIRVSFIQKINEFLHSNYVNNFEGTLLINQHREVKSVFTESEEIVEDLDSVKNRFVKMCSVEKYLDKDFYDTAVYIDDIKNSKGNMILAGKIISIIKKETAEKKKPYFVITFDDFSGKMTGRFFTSAEEKVKKLEKLGEGSVVIMRCVNEEFNGSLSLSIKGLHLCEFPKNYTLKEKPSKRAGETYKLIKPQDVTIVKQNNLFATEIDLPENFKNTEFTVVDIETTGLDVTKEKITEIGAVKIVNGKIVSTFTTLVNPQVKLTEENIKLTGITDEMLINAPKIEDVYHDFFKYLGNSVFVAHNAEFDFKFLRQAGRELGYILTNKVLDTLMMSNKILPNLKNHKLNTVCAYYNIEFRHHRALSDAFATSEMLIELVKTAKTFKI